MAKNKIKLPWLILTIGSVIGAAASFIQIIERIAFADNPLVNLSCDINNAFSCSTVFDGWQSSVFGFSNSIMCLLFFGVMLGVGLSGLFGTQLAKGLRLTMHFFSVFFLFFGAWYLQQSAFDIGALCLFCIFCYGGVILINWSWIRLNVNDLPLISQNAKKQLQKFIAKGGDTFFWALWAIVFVAMFILAFKK
jgi:uncharacterized membrane protein